MRTTALTLLLFFAALGMSFSQAPTAKNAFSAKLLFVDYGNPNGIEGLDVTNGLELAYIRNIAPWLNFAIPVKAGLANVADDTENNRNFASIDGILQLQYAAEDSSRFVPYLMGGGGLVWEDVLGTHVQIPVGLGANIRVGGRSYINLQGEYRLSQEEDRNNVQVGLGYLHRFGILDGDGDGIADANDQCPAEAGPESTGGCPDQDMDGVADLDDRCPSRPGEKRFSGCPDTDGDEIADDKDDCPEIAGRAKFNGCPDTDEDGIADKNDNCPEVKGVASAMGCPDADGDTVPDDSDECPQEAGLPEFNGCPFADSDKDRVPDEEDECPETPGPVELNGCPDGDGDGFADKDDKCPNRAGAMEGCPDTDGDGVHDGIDSCPEQEGPASNKGCPELEKEDREVLDLAMQSIQFETGKATLKPESHQVLGQVRKVMDKYPGYKLRISGHTDNVGEEEDNLKLSKERAKACFDFLVAMDINPARMSHEGFGESRPVAPNNTTQGRRLNRRVEFFLYVE